MAGDWAWKCLFALAIMVTGFLGASLAWAAGAAGRAGRGLALGNTFAAGVLGGAGLIHLLAAGMEGFRTGAPAMRYPLALLLAGASFLFILLIEGVILTGRLPAEEHGAGQTGLHHGVPPRLFVRGARLQALVLLVVLSIHSIVLGVTLGAQTSLSRLTVIFAAIIAHKAFAGFALGIGYRRSGLSLRRAAPAIAVFSLMVPLGALLGAAIGDLASTRAGTWFEAAFDSIGAGTFLYIASLDILRTEFEPAAGDRGLKWLLTAAGYGLMALLALWI